eukprot:Blabericola_migrator_1__2749@NODE_1785_length_3794_cov_53_322780_g1150_i0_p2_GENE_NODE_1785_length_3794_cov_53_322780_g1150_i0NODE_1785_length_3794_cov_53_322780_g1150_i0_p2_ORF_typecomplete_len193_score17_15_NODE_1785_length_3794_cov_53_322780_g1150_i06381216
MEATEAERLKQQSLRRRQNVLDQRKARMEKVGIDADVKSCSTKETSAASPPIKPRIPLLIQSFLFCLLVPLSFQAAVLQHTIELSCWNQEAVDSLPQLYGSVQRLPHFLILFGAIECLKAVIHFGFIEQRAAVSTILSTLGIVAPALVPHAQVLLRAYRYLSFGARVAKDFLMLLVLSRVIIFIVHATTRSN